MRINIYLEKDERNRLEKIKNRYHLSYSTIARLIVESYYPWINEQLEEHYIYEKKGYKTSIKPKKSIIVNKPSIVYTNAIKIFLKKDLKKYVDEKAFDQIQNRLYQNFEKEFDVDWNGAYMSHIIPKFIKTNKEYVKKLLESQD